VDECLLYLLRVWRRTTRFHACLRAVGEEQARHFERPDQLIAFLDAAATSAPRRGDNSTPERNSDA